MEALAWAFVAVLLLATVAANAPGRLAKVRSWDPLGLLPAWSFFAPHPGDTDPVVVVRDRLDDGTLTAWRLVWRDRSQRARWLWRPDKRTAKLISDCAASIRPDVANDPEFVELTPAYLLLARLAERAPHAPDAIAFQFAVLDVNAWWSDSHRSIVSACASAEIALAQR